jgi:eukaryotic-like serine/threonine-protein kinase
MSGQEAFLEPGRMLGRYRLLSAGVAQDVGAVHEAHDTVDDRPVVILVLPSGRLPTSEALRRLVDAQVTVASLGQPGLVAYEDVGIVAGRPYLVRPALPHQSLAQILAGNAPLEVRTALEIALRLCETLAPLHRAGMVHGSLSPYSVMAVKETAPGDATSQWAVTVVDAGLLPVLHSQEVPGSPPWGRSPYFSPEQAVGLEARRSSDVYVIASLLYAMLAGRPPFRGPDAALVALQHARPEPPSLDILVPGVSPRLAEVVAKGLEKEPANRYRNAGQMAQVLRGQLVDMQPVEESPTRPAGRGRLVVPPPPGQLAHGAAPARQTYLVEEDEEEQEEPAMVNCLTVLLLILALVAVLGLIPLWRTLYLRYTTPHTEPTPASEGWMEMDGLRAGHTLGPEWVAARALLEPILPQQQGSRLLRAIPPDAGWTSVGHSAPLVPQRSVPLWALNWSPGPFSGIMNCWPGICRGHWSQDYGFF